MADPMDTLRSYQKALNSGDFTDPNDLSGRYIPLDGEVPSGKRYDFVRVVGPEVQALAIFGEDEPIDGVPCLSVGYAVSESMRGCGLAVEAVNLGIHELIKKFTASGPFSFYVEAVVDVTNEPSIRVAEKLFPESRLQVLESESGRRAWQFKKLIKLS